MLARMVDFLNCRSRTGGFNSVGARPMQQIADWLEKLGLGQYAQRFAENDIDFTILSDLTDQDLKELGVSSLGHRRQLLRATAELNNVEKSTPKLPLRLQRPLPRNRRTPPSAAKSR